MYLYETHVHTMPTSACAKVGVREMLAFYQSMGYAGVFMTDHFIDGNFNYAMRGFSYEERINSFFSAFEEGQAVGRELGFSVFSGFEMSFGGTDFLVYGIDKAWCLAHPDMDKLPKSQILAMMIAEGALVIQAHPFREASYIDHIRLFPRHVQGVEVYNACRTEFENRMAAEYCKNYGLLPFAGSDNHLGAGMTCFGGMATEVPLTDERDFIRKVLSLEATPFCKDETGFRILA